MSAAWNESAGLPRPVVLCVDDERGVLLTLERQLSRVLDERFSLEFAQSAEEALEIVAELDPEAFRVVLLITDLHMPAMRGDVLMARLRLQLPTVPQILLTGQADLSGGCPPGVDHCLAKPWEPDVLVALLRKTLGARAIMDV